MLYKIGWAVCEILIRILFHVEIYGRENIPKAGDYMLVANHRTNFDPLFVVAGVKRNQVCFMAKAELFSNGFQRWLFKHLGAFPVERGKGDSGALDWAQTVVREGKILGMFPEGTRSKDGKPLRPKSGAAMIAMQTGTDVLPCAVCFGPELKFRTRVVIRYGKLLQNSELGFTPGANSPREIKDVSRRIMAQVVQLLEEG